MCIPFFLIRKTSKYYKYVHMLQVNKWMPRTSSRFETVFPFTIQQQQERITEIKCRQVKITTKTVSTFVFCFVLFLCPGHEMPGAYSITLFLPSFLLSFTFRSLSPEPLHTFNSNLIYWCVIEIYRLSLNFVPLWWFLKELCLLNLK